MPFTDEERRRWHEQKRALEPDPPPWRPEPVAECVNCHNPFGYNEGTITAEVAVCGICLGD